ncbi:wax ester/triacylglycerol synthase domain-containing protein [Williamsia sp. CHRR-6]|uniref:wax ester/triacylglycerol synthase domain-containing protein n=1 Tax=Williamsia sp. CHRR-6 TaxID=2835871 RepID=UPI001BD9DEF4|nr:wax ester/triacylglycerol synthase domain-containing protein [Williamsia sp. CHRR-6]MBT0567053.1 DUF1298 domain-containing protein [Williamsia sp. CHRR-6]
MVRLSARDAAYLLLDRAQRDAHVVSCTVLSTPDGVDDELRGDLLARLAGWVRSTDELFQVPIRVPADLDLPVWHRVDAIDLDAHISVHTGLDTWAAAGELLTTIADRPLEVNRPPWRLDVLADVTGLPGIEGRVSILAFSYHHAVMDGRRFHHLMFDHDWDTPPASDPTDTQQISTDRAPSTPRLAVAAVLRQPAIWGRFLWAALCVAARIRPGRSRPVTALTGVSPRRSRLAGATEGPRAVGFTVISAADVAAMRAQVHDATANDLMVSIIGQAVRSHLAAAGEGLTGEVFAAMPVHLVRRGTADAPTTAAAGGANPNPDLRNLFTTVAVNTRSAIDDPRVRLATIHSEIVRHKNRVRAAAGATGRAPGLIHAMPAPVLALIGCVLRRRGVPPSPVDIVISNLADTSVSDQVAGLKVVGRFSATSLSSPRLAHVIYRGNDRLFISVTADSVAIPVLDDYLSRLDESIDAHRNSLIGDHPDSDVP